MRRTAVQRFGNGQDSGEYRALGTLVLELPGLQGRTRLLAQRWALRPLIPFFPESACLVREVH